MFDKILSVVFGKIGGLSLLAGAIVSAMLGIGSSSASGVACTEDDCFSCILFGCFTPETTCDILSCMGGCACESACACTENSARFCSNTGTNAGNCLGAQSCLGCIRDSSVTECLDTNCTDENGNPACNYCE